MSLASSSSALRYGGNSGAKFHLEKSKPVVSPTFQPKPAGVSPCRLKLDEVALHAVEIGGLVVLVDEAEGHEEQAGAHRHRIIEAAIDVELLHFELTDITGRGHGVLDLVFGVELGALVEAVTDAEHRAREIEL